MIPTSILSASTRQRDQSDSLNAVAYRQIKEKIISLELPPASLVDEARLAEELALGLTPVRQALRRLALESLVIILPRRGTLVADLNFSDLQKVFEMRLELEPFATRLSAMRVSQEQLLEMKELTQQGLRLQVTEDNQQLLKLDHQMHQLIARCAQNEFLETTLEWLYCHVQRLWNVHLHRVSNMQQAMEEHIAIFDAIEAGDGERGASLMRQHVQQFQQDFTNSY